jgi:hypothetical protein
MKKTKKEVRKGRTRPPVHLRLPERSSLVRGKKNKVGEVIEKPDPRTASEDPTLKRQTGLKDAPQNGPDGRT